jgi:hypothetical protein
MTERVTGKDILNRDLYPLRRLAAFTYSKEQIGSALISLAIFSTFSPLKVYPILFLLAAFYLPFAHPFLQKTWWAVWLWIYIGYAFLLTFLLSGLGLEALPIRTAIGPDEITNFTKLIVNYIFLTSVVNWCRSTTGVIARKHLDLILHLTFFLTLLQLLVYIAHAGFGHIGNSESSSAASFLYDPSLCFWGVADKNIFGAKIALFGFLYIFNYFIWEHRLPVWRTMLVLLCAFLSNSRTPMAALFIGLVYVLFRHFRTRGRVLLGIGVAAIAPIFVLRLLRFESLLDTSDGMGIRIIYWSTFLSKFHEISVFGRGFMSSGNFLTHNSPIYLGEPHLHNLFLNSYLDFGIPGSVSYVVFLILFYKFCKRDSPVWFSWYWTAAFLPLLAIMFTLSAGYESDTVVYLSAIYIVGHSASTAGRRQVASFNAV